MIPRVEFASCYVYSPAGTGHACERSRLLRELLKEGNVAFMRRYALRVRQQIAGSSQLAGFLTASDMLVPVPGSTAHTAQPMAHRHAAVCLAEELRRQGLGCGTWHGLRRIRSVQKSATALALARPSVALHYESFAIDALPCPTPSLVLVDDIVTRGRTLLAAAARLHEAFPGASIKAFALLRTMGFVAQVGSLLEPCRGFICWRAGDARRNP